MDTMESIKQLLQSTDLDREVTVRGWVRTKRGNAYVNFVAVNDGSTVNSIQTVFEIGSFSEADLKEVTTGACISVVGKLVQSQGKGQSVEVQATSVVVHGAADPETFPMQPKKHSLGVSARKGPSAGAYQHLQRGVPHPPFADLRHSQVFQRPGLFQRPFAHHHRV
jgi:aspartyl/asparaginyl-tRNA synthetase